MLGDGRALLLGEQITPEGRRFDIQLKGSGPTPFSRRGDGLAALGPMLREVVISEAMHHLGIPTTRSLAVATTGEPVFRQRPEPGAVLTRVAASHIRVGTFQYARATDDLEALRALFDHTVKRHAPQCLEHENPALAWLQSVVETQARLIAHWMRVGFIHGVMNTDNMSLAGETIDYGPCAFMDRYHPMRVFSSIDHQGRYAYGNQPSIAAWNLARFAETILSLIHSDLEQAVSLARQTIATFQEIFEKAWLELMGQKLGLDPVLPGDASLIRGLFQWMHQNEADFTNTFDDLTQAHKNALPDPAADSPIGGKSWWTAWCQRLTTQNDPAERVYARMRQANPAIIPRNHVVHQALLVAEEDDLQPFEQLLEALKEPYTPRPPDHPLRRPPAPQEEITETFCGT